MEISILIFSLLIRLIYMEFISITSSRALSLREVGQFPYLFRRFSSKVVGLSYSNYYLFYSQLRHLRDFRSDWPQIATINFLKLCLLCRSLISFPDLPKWIFFPAPEFACLAYLPAFSLLVPKIS